MLYLIRFVTWICMSFGLYTLAAYKLRLPSYRVDKAVKDYNRNQGNKERGLSVLIQTYAVKLAPYIKMNEYKKSRLENALKTMGRDMKPEIFQATSIVKAIMVLLLVFPCLALFPIGSIAIVFFALITLYKDEKELRKELKKKKEEIEYELPRFACTIKQELTATRDVLMILDSYKKNAGEVLKKELEITTADMRSGNYESALLRFESRISSPMLSDIIRGLLGTLRGDNNQAYFEMLSHDLDELELQRLKAIAAKQPDKIKKYSFMLLICCISMYIVILGVFAYQSAKGI